MIRKHLIFILIITLLISTVPGQVFAAAKNDIVAIDISDGDNSYEFNAIMENDEIYLSAEAYELITDYEFEEKDDAIHFKLGSKLIRIDEKTGTISIPLFGWFGSEDCLKKEGGKYYIAASALLPWLNVECSINEDGTLEIIKDGMPIWKVLSDFDYNDLMFRIYDDWGDSAVDKAGLSAIIVFDTFLNARWDKLVPADGTVTGAFNDGSLYDYKCYVEALKDAASDDSFYLSKLNNNLSDLISLNKGLGIFEEVLGFSEGSQGEDIFKNVLSSDTIKKYNDIMEPWEDIRESLSSYSKVQKYLPVLSTLKSCELIISTDNEYRKYIEYLGDHSSDNMLLGTASKKVAITLDENYGGVVELYLNFAEQIMEQIPGALIKGILNDELPTELFSFDSVSGLTKAYGQYRAVAKILFDQVLGVADGFESMAKITVNQELANFTWNNATSLRSKEMTCENVKLMRQAYLTALRTSRKCFKSLSEVQSSGLMYALSGFQDNSHLQDYKVVPINDKIVELIATAECTENDSIEGKEEKQKEIKNLFKTIREIKKTEAANQECLEYYKSVMEEERYYSLLDLNTDGTPELLMTESVIGDDEGNLVSGTISNLYTLSGKKPKLLSSYVGDLSGGDYMLRFDERKHRIMSRSSTYDGMIHLSYTYGKKGITGISIEDGYIQDTGENFYIYNEFDGDYNYTKTKDLTPDEWYKLYEEWDRAYDISPTIKFKVNPYFERSSDGPLLDYIDFKATRGEIEDAYRKALETYYTADDAIYSSDQNGMYIKTKKTLNEPKDYYNYINFIAEGSTEENTRIAEISEVPGTIQMHAKIKHGLSDEVLYAVFGQFASMAVALDNSIDYDEVFELMVSNFGEGAEASYHADGGEAWTGEEIGNVDYDMMVMYFGVEEFYIVVCFPDYPWVHSGNWVAY